MNKHNLLLILAALSPMTAHATASWNFTTWNETNYGSQGTFVGSSGAGNVTVSAFSTTGGQDNGYGTFQTGTLGSWSGGIGVTSAEDGSFGGAPHHAFDNDGGTESNYVTPDEAPAGDVDAALFQFDQAVTLSNISLGWSQFDSDLSILVYNPTNQDPSSPTIIGKSFSELLATGWELVGNYGDVAPSGSGSATISTSTSSTYWLVSAFTTCANATRTNSSCVTGPSANGGSLDFGNDYFKISGLSGTIQQPCTGGNCGGASVPEPSSLFLLAGGLLGWRLNRKGKTHIAPNEALAA